MARKKAKPIESLGKDIDKLTVQKSRPLFALWKSEMTLAEFKILDIYLARIDSHNPDRRLVVFDKGELESVLGVKKINLKNLKIRLNHLLSNVVEISTDNSNKNIEIITLFEYSSAEQDENTGLWSVRLECTQRAMKYFFKVENLGYLRYKLRCITSITSRYTYVMFIYLEANRFSHLSWDVSLDELKHILNCYEEETYKEYKRFNDLVLKRIKKELYEKTECRYTYEPIRKGRSVVAIRFTLESVVVTQTDDQLAGQESFDNPKELEAYVDSYSTSKTTWKGILAEYLEREATNEETELIRTMLDASQEILPDGNDTDERMSKYLSIAVAKIRESTTRRKSRITDRYKYLIALIQKDIDKANKSCKSTVDHKETHTHAGDRGGGSTVKNFTERTDNNYTQMILDRYSKKE